MALGPWNYYGPYGSGGTTTASIALANALGSATIIYRVEDTRLFRNARGWFTEAQKEIEIRNRQLARTMQEAVVRETYRKLERPTVSTRRLRKAWMDSGHFQPASGGPQFGFGLFDPEIMDRSEAKYWRLIEYGSKDVLGGRWTGRMVDSEGIPLFGRWGGSIRGMGSNRWGSAPVAGPPWNSKRGKLAVLPQAVREQMINPRTGRRPKAAYRRKHIEPKNAIEFSWNKYGGERYANRLLTDIRKELGITR